MTTEQMIQYLRERSQQDAILGEIANHLEILRDAERVAQVLAGNAGELAFVQCGADWFLRTSFGEHYCGAEPLPDLAAEEDPGEMRELIDDAIVLAREADEQEE